MNFGKYFLKVFVNEKYFSVIIIDVLGKVNNLLVLLKRRIFGDFFNLLFLIVDCVLFKVSDIKKFLGFEVKKEKYEVSSVNKEKDDLFGRIMKSLCFIRRGFIGDVLNVLILNLVRRCLLLFFLIIKCDIYDELVLKI